MQTVVVRIHPPQPVQIIKVRAEKPHVANMTWLIGGAAGL
jgi:hypothetical protein